MIRKYNNKNYKTKRKYTSVYKKNINKGIIRQLQTQYKIMKKNIEKKVITLSYSYPSIEGNSGAIGSVMAWVGQGTANSQRIGNLISIKYLQGLFWINIETTTLRGSGSIDVILDRAPTGALPSLTDIYIDTEPERLIQFASKQRFKCLFNKHFTYGSGTIDNKGLTIPIYLPRKFNVRYTGNAGTIADLEGGANDILIVLRSSNTAVGGLSYGVKGSLRGVFTDT